MKFRNHYKKKRKRGLKGEAARLPVCEVCKKMYRGVQCSACYGSFVRTEGGGVAYPGM